MRENCATWYFSQISPTTGTLHFDAVDFLACAESRRDHQRKSKMAPMSAGREEHNILARRGADGDQEQRSWRAAWPACCV